MSHNRYLVFDSQKAALKMQMANEGKFLSMRIKSRQTELKDKNTADIMSAERKMTNTVE